MRRRMVNEVNKVIHNALLSQGELHLPNIGTLYIARKSAVMNGKRRVVTPEYCIDFSSSREARSVVDAIAECASITQKGAEDIYMLWLDKVRREEIIEIAGIGILRGVHFVTDNALMAELNPNRGSVVTITHQPRRYKLAISIAASVALLLGVVAYILLMPKGSEVPKGEGSQESVAELSEADIIAENRVEVDNDVAREPIAEIAMTDTTITESQTALPAISQEPIKEEVVETTATKSLDNRPWYEREDIKHYVVVGSYKKRRNAEQAMRDITKRSKNNDIHCQIIKRGKMHTVAVFGSVDIKSCEAFVASHKSSFAQAWVYSIEE